MNARLFFVLVVVVTLLLTGVSYEMIRSEAREGQAVEAPPAAEAPPVVMELPVQQPEPVEPPKAAEDLRATLALRPNELGQIMILEYHVIGDEELRWTRTRENFRRDLQWLYDHGYRTVGLHDYLDNRIDLPAGTSPVILSFDDSSANHFRVISGPNGQPQVDPDCAVGILQSFYESHPDFGRKAIFSVLPGADPPNDFFNQPEYRQWKLQWLVSHDMEIANHTLWHGNLAELDRETSIDQIAMGKKALEDLVPGYTVDVLTLPHGNYPEDLELAIRGSSEGVSYVNRAILREAGGPTWAPNDQEMDSYHIPRIQAVPEQLDEWFSYFQDHPEERYVSDGDPIRLTFPVTHSKSYRSSTSHQDLLSPDPAYRVIMLR